ncbi:MAG: pyridoxal phosphate-dependent aminotransferase [Alphaproteobacteria bacterium]|nr:pyridoxal phosphate-dependent aminotransferase [Alphaproteobacteria bacterium]
MPNNPTESFLASRLAAVRPSPTLALVQLAKELKAAGRDVVDLSAGEPDFDTPDHVQQAAIDAMARGETRYTAVAGTPELKKAIRAKFLRDNGLDYSADEVMAATGNKQLLFNAMMATLNAGDEVVIPAPYWVSYPDMVLLAGGQPVVVPCGQDSNFKLTPDALEAAITPKTKWLILCSPSNPTGSAYSKNELAALADVLRRHPQTLILSDDIYEKLVFDGKSFCNILNVAPDLKDRTMVANGVSKSHAMTGWRLGYAAAPAWLIKAMTLIQSQSTSNPSSISQAAAVAALEGDQSFLPAWVAEYQGRRDVLVAGLNAIDGISCLTPDGAFYVYANCGGLLGRTTPDGRPLNDDKDVAAYLLESAGVVALHGDACGLSPFLRLSFGNVTQDKLREACQRIGAAVAKLQGSDAVAA